MDVELVVGIDSTDEKLEVVPVDAPVNPSATFVPEELVVVGTYAIVGLVSTEKSEEVGLVVGTITLAPEPKVTVLIIKIVVTSSVDATLVATNAVDDGLLKGRIVVELNEDIDVVVVDPKPNIESKSESLEDALLSVVVSRSLSSDDECLVDENEDVIADSSSVCDV